MAPTNVNCNTVLSTPPSSEIVLPSPVMTNPVMLSYQNSDVLQALYQLNDLADDGELLLQLGT